MSARDERLTTSDLTVEGDDEPTDALLPSADGEGYQTRWRQIQERFVDEPRTAVQDADGLVAELMQRMAATFAQERERLETEWERGDEVSTEDLRRAMQHYRSFFHRLLAA